MSQRGLQILLLNDSVLVVADTPEVTAHRCRAGTATSEVDCVSPDTHPGVDCVTWRLREGGGGVTSFLCLLLPHKSDVMGVRTKSKKCAIKLRNSKNIWLHRSFIQKKSFRSLTPRIRVHTLIIFHGSPSTREEHFVISAQK